LIGAFAVEECGEFETFVMKHSKSASTDAASEANIKVFCDELLHALKAGETSADEFLIEYEPLPHAPDRPNQTGSWKSYRLYIDPEATSDQLQHYLTRKRAFLPLKRKDLRDQLSKNEDWIDGKITRRMGPSGKKAAMKV